MHVILFVTLKLLFSLMCLYLYFYYWFSWTAFVISIFFHWSIFFIITWIMNSNYNFISNNVKGIKASEKHLKLFDYLRNNISNNDFVFLPETHSSLKDEQKWRNHFKGSLFFSNGKRNSCGVSIGYWRTETFKVVNKAFDKNGRILILDAELNDRNFLLINLYNSNSESKQLSTFSSLQKLFVKFDGYSKKKHCFWR